MHRTRSSSCPSRAWALSQSDFRLRKSGKGISLLLQYWKGFSLFSRTTSLQIDIDFQEVDPFSIPARILAAFSDAPGIGETRVCTRVTSRTGSSRVAVSPPRRMTIGSDVSWV